MTVCELTSRANERPWPPGRPDRPGSLAARARAARRSCTSGTARPACSATPTCRPRRGPRPRPAARSSGCCTSTSRARRTPPWPPWPPLALLASYWYSLLHYVVTPAVLVWAYRRHHVDYRRVRDALVLASRDRPGRLHAAADGAAADAAGLRRHARHAPSSVGWWGSDASAPRGLGALTNQLAAMPSLHVGWAVWVRLGRLHAGHPALGAGRSAVAYPIGTTLVVVAHRQPLPPGRGGRCRRGRGRDPAVRPARAAAGAEPRSPSAGRERATRRRTGRRCRPRAAWSSVARARPGRAG